MFTLDIRQVVSASRRSEQTVCRRPVDCRIHNFSLAVLNTAHLACRATTKDAVKAHSIHTGIDTSYEEFQEQLSSKANEETQNIKEHSK